jgi:hypothetical protein
MGVFINIFPLGIYKHIPSGNLYDPAVRSSLPYTEFQAKITGIDCLNSTWRIEAELKDFVVTTKYYETDGSWDGQTITFPVPISIEGSPESMKQIIKNHTRLEREGAAGGGGRKRDANEKNLKSVNLKGKKRNILKEDVKNNKF